MIAASSPGPPSAPHHHGRDAYPWSCCCGLQWQLTLWPNPTHDPDPLSCCCLRWRLTLWPMDRGVSSQGQGTTAPHAIAHRRATATACARRARVTALPALVAPRVPRRTRCTLPLSGRGSQASPQPRRRVSLPGRAPARRVARARCPAATFLSLLTEMRPSPSRRLLGTRLALQVCKLATFGGSACVMGIRDPSSLATLHPPMSHHCHHWPAVPPSRTHVRITALHRSLASHCAVRCAAGCEQASCPHGGSREGCYSACVLECVPECLEAAEL